MLGRVHQPSSSVGRRVIVVGVNAGRAGCPCLLRRGSEGPAFRRRGPAPTHTPRPAELSITVAAAQPNLPPLTRADLAVRVLDNDMDAPVIGTERILRTLDDNWQRPDLFISLDAHPSAWAVEDMPVSVFNDERASVSGALCITEGVVASVAPCDREIHDRRLAA